MTFLIFLFPLAVYCLILSHLNRGRHALLVSGTWDFVGVLFAASGILLLGGPAILDGLYEQRRLAWVLGRPVWVPVESDLPWGVWVSLWAAYFVVVVGGAAWLLRRRRSVTAVYNVTPDLLSRALDETLHRLGWQGTSAGNRLIIHPAGDKSAAAVEFDTFPALRHVTLCWHGEPGAVRGEVEAELAIVLSEVDSGYNPAAAWFLGAALVLMCTVLFGMLLLLWLMTRGLR